MRVLLVTCAVLACLVPTSLADRQDSEEAVRDAMFPRRSKDQIDSMILAQSEPSPYPAMRKIWPLAPCLFVSRPSDLLHLLPLLDAAEDGAGAITVYAPETPALRDLLPSDTRLMTLSAAPNASDMEEAEKLRAAYLTAPRLLHRLYKLRYLYHLQSIYEGMYDALQTSVTGQGANRPPGCSVFLHTDEHPEAGLVGLRANVPTFSVATSVGLGALPVDPTSFPPRSYASVIASPGGLVTKFFEVGLAGVEWLVDIVIGTITYDHPSSLFAPLRANPVILPIAQWLLRTALPPGLVSFGQLGVPKVYDRHAAALFTWPLSILAPADADAVAHEMADLAGPEQPNRTLMVVALTPEVVSAHFSRICTILQRFNAYGEGLMENGARVEVVWTTGVPPAFRRKDGSGHCPGVTITDVVGPFELMRSSKVVAVMTDGDLAVVATSIDSYKFVVGMDFDRTKTVPVLTGIEDARLGEVFDPFNDATVAEKVATYVDELRSHSHFDVAFNHTHVLSGMLLGGGGGVPRRGALEHIAQASEEKVKVLGQEAPVDAAGASAFGYEDGLRPHVYADPRGAVLAVLTLPGAFITLVVPKEWRLPFRMGIADMAENISVTNIIISLLYLLLTLPAVFVASSIFHYCCAQRRVGGPHVALTPQQMYQLRQQQLVQQQQLEVQRQQQQREAVAPSGDSSPTKDSAVRRRKKNASHEE